MAFQAISGGIAYPQLWVESVTFTTDTTLDASTDRSAAIVPILTAGSIDKVAVRIGALTTAIALDVRLEGVSATTGLPTGALWATNTSGSIAVPTANTSFEVTLTAAATVAISDNTIAIVIQPSGTPVNLGIVRIASDIAGFVGKGPYGYANTTGSYAATTPPMTALHMSGGSWVCYPTPFLDSQATSAFSTATSATTGTARGLRFRLPFAARLGGCIANIQSAALSDFTFVLYSDAGSTLLTSQSFDKDTPPSGTGQRMFAFTSTYDLAANTWYRLAAVPSGGTMGFRELSVLTAALLDSFPGGQDCHLCAFISSAWVDTDTTRPRVHLWLTHLDDGVGGGGDGYLLVSN